MADVKVRFFQPHEALTSYITTYYLTEVTANTGERVTDYLHPEWANLRFIQGVLPLASIGVEQLSETHAFSVTGPTSRACQFVVGNMRAWGVGLLPSGWARFVGASADLYADRFVDGAADEAFAHLRGLGSVLSRDDLTLDQEVATIDSHFLALTGDGTDQEDHRLIDVAQQALVDRNVSTVLQFSELVGISPQSTERLSRRAFGFTPKLLLRRQRFLRSLSQFMLDPSMRWIDTLDSQYFDQAHFTRDFTRFMGMSARQYASLGHPILGAAARARLASAGAAMQVLHSASDWPKLAAG